MEGNHLFPTGAGNRDFPRDSDARTTRPWKGTSGYDFIEIDGKVNREAAWI